jgi:hypothetical protein
MYAGHGGIDGFRNHSLFDLDMFRLQAGRRL